MFTTDDVLYPEDIEFSATIFYIICLSLLVGFALLGMRHEQRHKRLHLKNSETNKALTYGYYLRSKRCLLLFSVLVLAQLLLFYFWPRLFFEHPSWLNLLIESFDSPINELIRFIINLVVAMFNVFVLSLASYGLYRFIRPINITPGE